MNETQQKRKLTNCLKNSMIFKVQKINEKEIKTRLLITNQDLETIKEIEDKENREITTFKLYYDVIHTLSEILLGLKNKKSYNHECLFTSMCEEYKELTKKYDLFERMRIKRNKIHYQGIIIDKKDSAKDKIKFKSIIKVMKTLIQKEINTSRN